MAEASLAGMPLELLVHIIATYLPTKDLGALRLTSKYLETALFDTFAKEFFTKKQFMLSTFSLDVLINISKHPALAPFVKHVIIGLDQYEPPVRHHSWSDISQCEAFRNGWADQYTLTSSGRDREMLAEAFRNLPNLSTVGIRDYNAQGRTRDEDRWRSYGAPTASRQSGIPLRGASSEYATRVYTLLFQALADANNPTRSVEIILRTPGTGLSDFAFFLPAVTTMRPVLDGLQQLLLTLNFKEHLSMDNPVIAYQASNVQREQSLLESFLFRTPALRHLRLNFQQVDQDTAPYILEGFSRTTNLLPALERFELGMVGTTPDLLLQVLSGFAPTLRRVGLWKFKFLYSVLPRWNDADGRFNPWPRFLSDLRNVSSLRLDSVTLGCLTQWEWSNGSARVNFASGKVSEEGTGDMAVFLPKIIDNLRVQWPAPPPESEEDEDNDMIDEDED